MQNHRVADFSGAEQNRWDQEILERHDQQLNTMLPIEQRGDLKQQRGDLNQQQGDLNQQQCDMNQ